MGEAGGSAERRADELRALGLKSAGAWAAGAVGERRVAEALIDLPSGWLVLHDRLLFPGRSETNLDHVLVGPAGVVLIDAKNWAGHLTEWEGGLFKHQCAPDGHQRHIPLHREVDKVLQMGTEMARRLQVPVLVAVALAGTHADDFGEPRLVRNVWVVPLKRLVEWLTTRPVIDADQAQHLGVLARTEFPSTTTDWRLLAAMGQDLDRRGESSGMASGHSRAGGRTPSRRVAVGQPPPRRQRKVRQPRRSPLRLVAFLAGVLVLLWVLQSGVVAQVGAAVSSALVGRMVPAAGTQAPAVPSDTALSCANVDTRSLNQLRKFNLAPNEGQHACVFAATMGKSNSTVISIKEAHASYPMVTQLASSRKAKAPILTASNSLSGKVTLLHVAKGVTLTYGKPTSPASRDLEVLVWHEALGLTAKQGKQLAIRVAMGVEGAPPTPTAPATH